MPEQPTPPTLSDEQRERLTETYDAAYAHAAKTGRSSWHLIEEGIAAMLAEARLEGRREAAGAIDFDTTCLNCARVIEKSASAYFDGWKAAAEQIAQALDESEDLHNSPGFDVSPRCPGCQAARIARQHGGQR